MTNETKRYSEMTPDELDAEIDSTLAMIYEDNRKRTQKQLEMLLLKRLAIFIGFKVGIAVATHFAVKAIQRKLDAN